MSGRACSKKCSIFGCGQYVKPTYGFPNPKFNFDRFTKWVRAAANPKYHTLTPEEIFTRGSVCNKHFSREDFLPGYEHKPRLRREAVPSLNLPPERVEREQRIPPIDVPASPSYHLVDLISASPKEFITQDVSPRKGPSSMRTPPKVTQSRAGKTSMTSHFVRRSLHSHSSDDVSERTETEVDLHKPFRFTAEDSESEESLHTVPPIYTDKSTPKDKQKLSLQSHPRKRCAIRNCPNSKFNGFIRYFSFPYDPELAQRWRDVAENPALKQLTFLQLATGHFVCWSHFEDNQFKNTDKKRLLSNQVPTVNLPSQKNDLLRAALEGINLNGEKVVHRPLLDPHIEIKEEILSNDDVLPFTDKIEVNPPIGNQPALQVENEPIIQIGNYEEQEKNRGYIFSSIKVRTENGTVEMCRICLKPVNSERKLISDNPEEKESVSLKHCVNFVLPDLNFDIYRKAYICSSCESLLKSSYELKKSWLRTEEILQKCVLSKDSFNNQPVNVTMPDADKEITGNQPLYTDGWNDDSSFDRDETTSIINGKSQKVEIKEKQLYVVNDHDYLTKPRHDKWGILAVQIYSETNNIFDSRLDKCFQQCSAVRYFRRHVRRFLRVGWGGDPHLCETCGQMYQKLDQYKRHVNHHQELRNRVPIFTCEICGVTIENADIRAHYRAKHTPRRFSCNICNRKFVFAHILNIHKKVKHERHKPKETSQCHVCGVKLVAGSVKQHIRRHSLDDKNVECTICGKKFFYAGGLREHIKIHSDETWDCHICGKKLKYQKSLEKHIRFRHLKQGDSICTICNKLFWNKGKLNEHHRRMHSTENTLTKVKGSEAAGYACPHCEKIFMYQKSLKAHIHTAHFSKGTKCVICDKILTRKSNLRDHYIKVHRILDEKDLAEHMRDSDQDTDKCPGEDIDEHIENNVKYKLKIG